MDKLLVEITEALNELAKLELNPQAKVVVRILRIIVWVLGNLKNLPE